MGDVFLTSLFQRGRVGTAGQAENHSETSNQENNQENHQENDQENHYKKHNPENACRAAQTTGAAGQPEGTGAGGLG